MSKQEKKFHYLYKTTCLITGKYYIGIHSTNNIEDSYMGSGKRLRRSIRKYGVDNHKKEILEFFDSRELLIEAEKKIITLEMIGDVNCMNLMSGGTGGWVNSEIQKKCSILGNKILNEKLKNDSKFKEDWLNKMKCGIQKSIKNNKWSNINDYYSWLGKSHSETTKEKIKNSMKGKNVGVNNSQHNTHWVTKDGINKKIKKDDLSLFEENGWVKGRVIKKQ